jgi:hypothetical protein
MRTYLSVAWERIWLHGDPRYIAYPSGNWLDYGFRLLPLTGAVAGIEDAFDVWCRWFLVWGESVRHFHMEDTLDQLFVPGSNGITDEDQKRTLEVLKLALHGDEAPLRPALNDMIAGTNPANGDDPQTRFRKCLETFAARHRRCWNLRQEPPRVPNTEYPLVGELNSDRNTQRLRLPDRDHCLVRLGFPPDYWIDPKRLELWPKALLFFPLEPRPESVTQWWDYLRVFREEQRRFGFTETLSAYIAVALNIIVSTNPQAVPREVWAEALREGIESVRCDPTLPLVNVLFDLARLGYTAFRMPVPPERPGSAGENLVLFLDRLEHWLAPPEGHIVDVPSAAVAAPPPGKGSKGIPLAEAEVRVRDWLVKNAKDNPDAVTRDQVARATGVRA